jgi:hypothetical protein
MHSENRMVRFVNIRRYSSRRCVRCEQHKALFRHRGRISFNKDHNLCLRCYRSAMDRLLSAILAQRCRGHQQAP